MSTVAGVQSSSSRHRAASSASSSIASRCARTSASCEPTWKCSPSSSRPAWRAARTASTASSAPSPNLEPHVPGADRLVRLGLDAGHDAHKRSPHSGRGRARRLVERVEDDERVGPRGGAQLLVRFVVAVHDQPLAADPGPPCERELAQRRDVGADPLLGEQAHDRDVGKGLRPEDDERPGSGAQEHPCALPERRLGVDDERRPETVRELGHTQPFELQHARRDPRSGREQC